LVAEIQRVAASVQEVDSVGRCQVRWMGHRLRADIEIEIDGSLSVTEGHDVASAVHFALCERVAHLDDVHVHVDPSGDHGPGHNTKLASAGRFE
jgi:divalent metal cation (Fe/Co/Zn/Cd) transporter